MSLAVPAGSRVLVVRTSTGESVDALIEARGCTVEVASVAARSAFAADVTFDAIVMADGFEHLDDPFAALSEAASLLVAGGHVTIVAKNAAHGRARVNEFLGVDESESSPLPPRQYDLAALERVVAKAGLVVLDRIRVLDAASGADGDADLLARADGPEARTSHFVLVTARAGEAVSTPTPTLTEVLQRALDERAGQVHELAAELERARTENDDQRVELAARADALIERIELVDRLHTERHHLELDLAVKDDYIAILRGEVISRRADYDALRFEFDELLRSRHYRAAVFMHRMLKKVPLVHRLVTGTTRVAKSVVRRRRPQPPA